MATESGHAPVPPHPPRRAAILGRPVAHSRSPRLHLAAYRALGLDGWTYDRIECGAEELPSVVGGLGPEWVGLSVTMPGKFAALRLADERTERAELLGSANTLVRTAGGWRADNTDVDGVAGALADGGWAAGPGSATAIVLGSGGTSPAAVAGLARLGVRHVTVAARNPARAARLLDLAATLGVRGQYCGLDDGELCSRAAGSVVISTLPAEVAARYAASLATAPLLLDAIYDPWPTPLAAAVSAAGGRVISGLRMLLYQAFSQVEQFTGRPAPREQMAAALE